MYFSTDFSDSLPATGPVAPAAPAARDGFSLRAHTLAEPVRPWGIAALPGKRHPSFRVLEVTRDSNGRPRKIGQVWQPDLDAARRFARVVAVNSSADRVLVTDAAGEVLERLSVTPPEARDGSVHWGNWRSLALPALPPRTPRAAPRRPQVRQIDLPVLDEYGGSLDLALPQDD